MPENMIATTALNTCPTMLIGLGGTGKDVLLRVRKQFFERQGQSRGGAVGYPIIGYLVLDTDSSRIDHPNDDRVETPEFVRERIKLQQGDIPEIIVCRVTKKEVTDYFSGKNQLFPHVFKWLPQEMYSTYGAEALEEGAGQNRLFGRLAFFHHYKRIRATLEARLAEIIRHATLPELQKAWLPENAQVDQNRLEVGLVYSLAGGTGCGMFMDMAFLVQDILLNKYSQMNVHITHFLFLPEVLISREGVLKTDEKQKIKVQENAFAALREMEYFANRQDNLYDLSIPPKLENGTNAEKQISYKVGWEPTSTGTPVYGAPWNTCYLVGASNDALQGTPIRYADLYQMVAEYLYLDFDLSDFGSHKRASRSNLVFQTQEKFDSEVKDEAGRTLFNRTLSRRFSVFGLSQIQFDRDRMRRAGAQRLASHLLDWWLKRKTAPLVPGDVNRLAAADLAADTPTATPLDGDTRPFGLSYSALTKRLLRKDLSTDETWAQLIQKQYSEKRAAIESPAFDPLAQDPFSGWAGEHENRLQKRAVGTAKDGVSGVARDGFSVIRKATEPEIETRLNNLIRFRIRTLGLENTLALVRGYAAVVADNLKLCDGVLNNPEPAWDGWRRRLDDAKAIPLGPYARTAARFEYLRGLDQVKQQIGYRYQKAVGEDVRACLVQLRRRTDAAEPADASYQIALDRFVKILENPQGVPKVSRGVREYLGQRFAELSRPDRGRRSEGGPSSDGRVVALLEEQREAEYDKRLAKALRVAELDALDADAWTGIERKVLAELSRSSDRRLRDVNTIDDLVLSFFPLDKEDPITQETVNRLAEELARACEQLLTSFATDLNALQLYEQQTDRPYLLDHLRLYSSPYLLRNRDVDIADKVDINTIQYLGLSDSGSSDGRRFEEDLRRSGEKASGSLAGLKSFRMEDDAIVVYQEKAGIPLCYYSTLDSLGRLYDSSRRPRELHIDPFFQAHAPEIRRVSQQNQQLLANCLELVLQGVITRLVRVQTLGHEDLQQVEFIFRAPSQDHLDTSLGNHLDGAIRALAVQDRLRGDLVNGIAAWMDAAALDHKGEPIAVLWAANWSLYYEIRARVQGLRALYQSNAPGSIAPPRHPLLGFLRERMIAKLESRIRSIPDAYDKFLAPLRTLQDAMDDLNRRPEDREQARRQWDERIRGAFAPVNEDDLPIPVLTSQFPRFYTAE